MAYFDTKRGSLEEAIRAAVKNEKMDAVNKTAVKKKFDDRKDKDIDNDGDVDASDKYLHKRRKAISKAIKSEDYLDEKMKIGNKQIDFELFSGEKGSKAANMAMNKEIRRASQMKDYKSARAYMQKVQDKYAELGAEDSEPQRTIDAILGAVFKEAMKSEDLAKDDEKSVGKVIKGLKKAVKIHQGQVDSLTKDIKDSYIDEDKVSFGGALAKEPKGYMVTAGEGDNKQKVIGTTKNKNEAEKIRDDWNKKNNPKKPSHRARVYASRDGKVGKVGDDVSYSQFSQKANYMKIKEAFEYGTPEAIKNSLNMTPGQSTEDWDKQVGVMQEKQVSMRETLAKMWDVEEGHNPFKKEEEKVSKKEDKTMTGKPLTKVSINSDGKKD